MVVRLIPRSTIVILSAAFLLPFTGPIALSQTYNVGANGAVTKKSKNGEAQASGQQLGWGSSIETARLAKAAQLALQRGDHAQALDYAQRAARSAPNNPQAWFLLGYAARLDGQYGQAVAAYQRGLKLSPSSQNGLSGLAQTYGLMGNRAEAIRLLTQVVTTNPGQRDDLLILGNIELQQGNYSDALKWLGKAEAVRPGAHTELLMALAYQRMKQLDMASRYLQMAKSRAPNNPDIARSLAGYYRDTGDYAAAIKELKGIRSPAPDALAELAYTYQLNGQANEAATLYARVAGEKPRDLNSQLSAAQAQVAVNHLHQAEVYLDRAAQLDPHSYRLHAIRGQIAQQQDNAGRAAHEYAEAIANVPAAPVEGPLYPIQLHMTLEGLYRSLNRDADAQKQLEIAQSEISKLSEHGTDRPAFLRLRALIRMSSGNTESALNDVNESLRLQPGNPGGLQLKGDLLSRLGKANEAIPVYQQILAQDRHNRYALTSLGYALRAAGDESAAEKDFELLARSYPSLYVPHLALGDLYTARGEYRKAELEYSKGYKLNRDNALIIAGGMNAAIEGHNLTLAGDWLRRVKPGMEAEPQLLKEKERYFSFKGNYQESAQFGEKAIQSLPRDRDVVVYLGYDLLRMGKYNELLALMNKYMDVLPKEPDIPLLAGYVYKYRGERERAVEAFTTAIDRDPSVTTAYVNRGFVRNDLGQPKLAAADFQQALKQEPDNGQAHLGLAFSELALDHSGEAVRQSFRAEKLLGDSQAVHIIRATAYGREGILDGAAEEYRAALRFTPRDGSLHLGLAQVLFANRHYHQAIAQLQTADKYLPQNAAVHALMARAYANLQERPLAMQQVQLAERYAERSPGNAGPGAKPGDIYVATGEALDVLGDRNAAMERFGRALAARGSNRVNVRLAIAQLMAQQGQRSEAQRQIALAQMEAAAGDTAPVTGSQYVEAANILQGMHEYELSQTYLDHAEAAGAPNTNVQIARANNFLALGETARAAAALDKVSRKGNDRTSYPYLLAEGSLYEQQQRNAQAVSAFAAAANAAGEDQTAEQALMQAGGNEGIRITPNLSVLSNVILQPIYEDSTVYVLDAKLDSPSGPVSSTDFANLPPPRSSLETDWTTAYHLHFGSLPTTGGFFQLRNARGQISVPATNSIVNRNTFDTIFNYGISPAFHLGKNVLSFNSGIQETVRRDTLSPVQMNQNLFRFYTYLNTSSFFNAVSAQAYFIHESGPFTESPIYESAITGAVNFRVGAPWSNTALVTGWASNDQLFTSTAYGNSENYFTSSYIGLTQRVGEHWNLEGIAEDLRSWRVVPFSPLHSAISQALRPAGKIEYSPNRKWDFEANAAYENTRGFHAYDMIQSGFALSYTRPFGRTFNDKTGEVHLKYPIRFSAGIQEETFPNFALGQNTVVRPYVSIHIF